MRKARFPLALVIIAFLTFQACSPDRELEKLALEIVDAVVAVPPLGYETVAVSGGNWLSTAGNQQNYQMWLRKSLTTESIDSECSYVIDWATKLGATQFRDGLAYLWLADENIPLMMLSGNEAEAQRTCVEVLSLVDMDPGIESGSVSWQIFGNYHSDDISPVDFGIEFNHSYDKEADKTELTHNLNLSFFTMLGETP